MKKIITFTMIMVVTFGLFTNGVVSVEAKSTTNGVETKENDNIILKDQASFVESLDEVNDEDIDQEYMEAQGLAHAIGTTEGGNVVYSTVSREEILDANSTKASRSAGNVTSIDTWVQGHTNVSLARIEIEGVGPVYCIDPDKMPPYGDNYDGGSIYNNDKVNAILWYGYPANVGGLRPAGYTDADAYLSTYFAINTILYPNGFKLDEGGILLTREYLTSGGDSYMNELVKRGEAGVIPQTKLTITAPKSTTGVLDRETMTMNTGWYTATGGSTVIPSGMPKGVGIELKNGTYVKNGETMASNQQFRFSTSNLEFEGNVNASFKSDIKQRAGIMYTPSSTAQRLVARGERTLIPNVNTSAKFVRATTDLSIYKIDSNTGEKVSGASMNVYTMFDGNREELINPVDGTNSFVSDENGEINISNVEVGAYEVCEFESPEGYMLLEGCLSFDVDVNGANLVEVEYYNTSGSIVEFEKQDDETFEVLKGAEISVEYLDEEGELVPFYDGIHNAGLTDAAIDYVLTGEYDDTTHNVVEVTSANLSTYAGVSNIAEGDEIFVDVEANFSERIPAEVLEIASSAELDNTFTTDVLASEIELPYGSYVFTETAAPAGYVLESSEEVLVEVTTPGEVIEATMYNTSVENFYEDEDILAKTGNTSASYVTLLLFVMLAFSKKKLIK